MSIQEALDKLAPGSPEKHRDLLVEYIEHQKDFDCFLDFLKEKEEKSVVTLDELFNLAAPIAIMHGADLMFEPQAIKAIKKLIALQKDPEVATNFGYANSDDDWEGYIEYEEPSDGLHDIQQTYIDLFRRIVERERPDWETFFDRWGARAYRDSKGKLVFAGDSSFRYPWFETAALLVKRIHEHNEGEA
jgi:hypothetical protein